MLAASAAALAAAPLALWSVMQPAGSWVAAIVLMCAAYGLLNMYYGTVYSAAPGYRGARAARHRHVDLLHGDVSVRGFFRAGADRQAERHDGPPRRELAGSSAITEAARATGLQQAMFVIPVLSLGLALVLYAGSRTVAPRYGGARPAVAA